MVQSMWDLTMIEKTFDLCGYFLTYNKSVGLVELRSKPIWTRSFKRVHLKKDLFSSPEKGATRFVDSCYVTNCGRKSRLSSLPPLEVDLNIFPKGINGIFLDLILTFFPLINVVFKHVYMVHGWVLFHTLMKYFCVSVFLG